MEDFYFYACIVALIILIVILTMVGITISMGNSTKRYPLNAASCPDYWTVSGDYCIYPSTDGTNRGSSEFQVSGNPYPTQAEISTVLGNLGSIAYTAYDRNTNTGSGTITSGMDITDVASKIGINGALAIRMNNNDASWNAVYKGITPRCAKRKWAMESGIVWDGITNYNGCS